MNQNHPNHDAGTGSDDPPWRRFNKLPLFLKMQNNSLDPLKDDLGGQTLHLLQQLRLKRDLLDQYFDNPHILPNKLETILRQRAKKSSARS